MFVAELAISGSVGQIAKIFKKQYIKVSADFTFAVRKRTYSRLALATCELGNMIRHFGSEDRRLTFGISRRF